MSRRIATKQIHYVRATYNANNLPSQNFEALLRKAMRKLGSMKETEIVIPKLGIASVRNRRVKKDESVLLAIGAGTPGESMTTLGLKVASLEDTDATSMPPDDRAFKLSDAFLLVEENDILLITDGQLRTGSVATYLRMLFEKSNLEPSASAFSFKKVSNQDKQKVLEAEGIKEMHLDTTMHRATRELDFKNTENVGSRLRGFVAGVKDLFAEEAENSSEQDFQRLSENWDQLQVSTIIKAKGGSRAEDIVLKTIEAVGCDVLDEASNDVDVKVVTQKGTTIHLAEIISMKSVRLRRRKNANDLVQLEVYDELEKYRGELIAKHGWLR